LASLSIIKGDKIFKGKRKSAKQLLHNQKSVKRLKKIIQELLEEREPFKRKGYPRAGAFDRLSMVLLEETDSNLLHLSFFYPAPRMVYTKEIKIEGTLEQLLVSSTPLPVNGLLLVGHHLSSGVFKYGEELTLQFAQLEQGIFLQALHKELSSQKIENHLQGGLRLENLKIMLPVDMEGVTGLVV